MVTAGVDIDDLELCEVVEEVVELYRSEGRELPPATAGRDFATRMQDVA